MWRRCFGQFLTVLGSVVVLMYTPYQCGREHSTMRDKRQNCRCWVCGPKHSAGRDDPARLPTVRSLENTEPEDHIPIAISHCIYKRHMEGRLELCIDVEAQYLLCSTTVVASVDLPTLALFRSPRTPTQRNSCVTSASLLIPIKLCICNINLTHLPFHSTHIAFCRLPVHPPFHQPSRSPLLPPPSHRRAADDRRPTNQPPALIPVLSRTSIRPSR